MKANKQILFSTTVLVAAAVVFASQNSFAQSACGSLLAGQAADPKIEMKARPAALATSGDGLKELISLGDNQLAIRDLKTNEVSAPIPGQFAGTFLERLSEDGTRLTVGSREYLETSAPVLNFPAYMGLGRNGGIRVIDVKTGKIINTFIGGISSAVSRDGKTLATQIYGDRMLKIWDVDSGKMLSEIKPGPAAFSPDGKTVLIRGRIYDSISDVHTGKTIKRMFNHGIPTFGPSGESVWYVNGQSVTERNLTSDEITFTASLPKHANRYYNDFVMNFAQGGNLVAISAKIHGASDLEENFTQLINRKTGKSTVLPIGYAHRTKFSHNGKFIAVIDVTRVAVYNTNTFEKVFEYIPTSYHLDMLYEASFNADDTQLVIRRDKTTMTVDLAQ